MKTTGTWIVEDNDKTQTDEVATQLVGDFVWVHLNGRVAFHAPQSEMAEIGREIVRTTAPVERDQLRDLIARMLWARGIGSIAGGRNAATDIVDQLIATGALAVKES